LLDLGLAGFFTFAMHDVVLRIQEASLAYKVFHISSTSVERLKQFDGVP
jgi:hypothetical protein